jgi:hypothetical protein
MQSEQPSSENFNVLGGEVEKNSFDGNNAPIFKDISGSVTINHNYSPAPKDFYHYNSNKTGDENKNIIQEDGIVSRETIPIKDKLNSLFTQKRELEIRLECIESEISRIRSAWKSEIDPNLAILLHWLSDRKELAEKYGKIALRRFRKLKEEAEAKGDLDDFYFEVENYLESISFSLEKDDKIFLQESTISPTFADPDIYENASSDAYREVFKILKENIPKDDVEPSLRSKLEDHFDKLLERLQAYF